MSHNGKASIWAVVFVIIIVGFIVNLCIWDSLAVYIILAVACAGAIIGEKTNGTLLGKMLSKKGNKKFKK